MSDPQDLFNEIHWRTMTRWMSIHSFRSIGNMQRFKVTPIITEEHKAFIREIFTNPEYDEIFKDESSKSSLKDEGWEERFQYELTMGCVANFQIVFDSASIVFAHSILDNASFEYCRVISLKKPDSFYEIVRNKKVSLEEVHDRGYSELQSSLINGYLAVLERESLQKKISRLFALCRPKPDFRPIKGYSYDENRIVDIDEFRNKIVHGTDRLEEVHDCEDILKYIENTCLFLMMIVSISCGVKIDPTYLTKMT